MLLPLQWLALCSASVWDHPSYWQLTHSTQNYLWHIFRPTPEHQGSASTHQVYHFWHWTSLISTCREMRSTVLHRPVPMGGRKCAQAPLRLKQLILLHFRFITLEMSFLFSIYRNGSPCSLCKVTMHYYYVRKQSFHTEVENLLNDNFGIMQFFED